MTDTSQSVPRDPIEHVNCAACRSLDSLDGVEDGHLFTPVVAARIRDERRIVRTLLRAQDRAADRVTSFAGSLNFVYLHSVWFGIWIALNVGILGSTIAFDKYPFGLLTMIVSLEAIFLSTFVMVSQNRQSARSDIRSQLDFETNLRAEIWSVHIGAALNIDESHVEDVVRHAIAAQNANANAST
jgi:Predicted membrane protein